MRHLLVAVAATLAVGASAVRDQGEPIATENVKTFTDGNFADGVMKSDVPVLVYFWAEWALPSRRMEPTVKALATEYAGKVTVGKLNVDENSDIPLKFKIRSIPTVLIFKGGQVVESVVGQISKEDLKKLLDKHIGESVGLARSSRL